jgi:hypothetical protein
MLLNPLSAVLLNLQMHSGLLGHNSHRSVTLSTCVDVISLVPTAVKRLP